MWHTCKCAAALHAGLDGQWWEAVLFADDGALGRGCVASGVLRCPDLGLLREAAVEHAGAQDWGLDFVEVLHSASQER